MIVLIGSSSSRFRSAPPNAAHGEHGCELNSNVNEDSRFESKCLDTECQMALMLCKCALHVAGTKSFLKLLARVRIEPRASPRPRR